MMAIKVQPSRFAVLHVEDDDDDSDEKETKPKQTLNKGGQQATEQKKKHRKKKKPDQTRNEPEEAKNKASKKSVKTGAASDSQWEEWMQKNDDCMDLEFKKELNDALLQSRLEYEEKQRSANSGNLANSGEEKKTKKNKTSAAVANPSESVDVSKTRNLEPSTAASSSASAKASMVSSTDGASQSTKKMSKEKENKPKENSQKKAPIRDYKAALQEKEEEVRELREHNRKIEAEVADVKTKNHQLYLILGHGEMTDKPTLHAELEKHQQQRDVLTQQVAQCLSELEKERSKSHSLKAEREKLKGCKHGGK